MFSRCRILSTTLYFINYAVSTAFAGTSWLTSCPKMVSVMARNMAAKIASALLILTAIAGAQTAASVRDGVYTAAQADRGKTLYAANCASCHGPMLDGSGAAPPLAGADFIGNWKGQ